MADQPPLSAGQAVGRWVLYVLLFILAGGIAAGGSAVVYESVSSAQNPLGLYVATDP